MTIFSVTISPQIREKCAISIEEISPEFKEKSSIVLVQKITPEFFSFSIKKNPLSFRVKTRGIRR